MPKNLVACRNIAEYIFRESKLLHFYIFGLESSRALDTSYAWTIHIVDDKPLLLYFYLYLVGLAKMLGDPIEKFGWLPGWLIFLCYN